VSAVTHADDVIVARAHVAHVFQSCRRRDARDQRTRPRPRAHHHRSRLDDLTRGLDMVCVEPLHVRELAQFRTGVATQCRQGAISRDHGRGRFQYRVSPTGEGGKPLLDCRGGDALRGRTCRRKGGEYGVGAGSERELRGRVQQLHSRFGLECAPPLRGALCHCDVARIGIPQPKDTGAAVRPTARVSDRVSLEHQHVAAAAQCPRGRESE